MKAGVLMTLLSLRMKNKKRWNFSRKSRLWSPWTYRFQDKEKSPTSTKVALCRTRPTSFQTFRKSSSTKPLSDFCELLLIRTVVCTRTIIRTTHLRKISSPLPLFALWSLILRADKTSYDAVRLRKRVRSGCNSQHDTKDCRRKR